MIHVEQQIGRAMQHFPLLLDKAIELLQKYLDHAQRDSHRFYHAHWDLAYALFASAARKFDAKTDEASSKLLFAEAQQIVRRIDLVLLDAEKCIPDFLPISKPPLDNEYAIIPQVRSHIIQFKLEIRERLMREKGGKGGNTPPSLGKKGGKTELKCWGCDKEGGLVCSRCKTARFCSAECQKQAWKQHKPDCNKICGAQK
jgi:hypothetical protein